MSRLPGSPCRAPLQQAAPARPPAKLLFEMRKPANVAERPSSSFLTPEQREALDAALLKKRAEQRACPRCPAAAPFMMALWAGGACVSATVSCHGCRQHPLAAHRRTARPNACPSLHRRPPPGAVTSLHPPCLLAAASAQLLPQTPPACHSCRPTCPALPACPRPPCVQLHRRRPLPPRPVRTGRQPASLSWARTRTTRL